VLGVAGPPPSFGHLPPRGRQLFMQCHFEWPAWRRAVSRSLLTERPACSRYTSLHSALELTAACYCWLDPESMMHVSCMFFFPLPEKEPKRSSAAPACFTRTVIWDNLVLVNLRFPAMPLVRKKRKLALGLRHPFLVLSPSGGGDPKSQLRRKFLGFARINNSNKQ